MRIGIHALIPGSFLATLVERYREQHPGIDVEIAEGTARESVMRLRANRLDLTFVAGAPEFSDCHARPIWRERLLAALPARHPLGDGAGVTWADLAGDTFIVCQGGTGPQVHDHIVVRLAGTSPDLSILRFDVERGTLLSMVAQGYGVTIVGEATSLMHLSGVRFLPILDELEPLPFSAIWSPHNRSPALRSLLDIAGQMSRSGRSI
ncbi:LysR family transcriptional regulator [Aureimonas fodinaquatilis]|uniref:LysR family transcriptional regulator n=1 Tax=Aureimonas fodinaquatilis TaxID=2565783 RepID=A0A5B0DNC0_9HYPH|nr:LysR family substrate-binding domain-containing protein [Aureimonas fodinaquatilis]KAA0968284.1 LysR family transcriptional regulator [Aureimonas fodinaquatilis]